MFIVLKPDKERFNNKTCNANPSRIECHDKENMSQNRHGLYLTG